ncbi:MAG: AIR synthase-related protein, partial [Pseudomonadota bacterium]
SPQVNLAEERKVGDFIRPQITANQLRTVHDISGGGLLVALAHMALAGSCCMDLSPIAANDTAFWFGEDQARYIAGCNDAQALITAAEAAGIDVLLLGRTNTTQELKISAIETMSLATLAAAYENWLPNLMN